MRYREVDLDRSFLIRLESGRDWRGQIEAFAEAAEIGAGWFSGLGAVRSAELWYYDQDGGQYEPFAVDEPMEVAACTGNVSILDGEPFAHTHAVLSDPTGRSVAGHLNEAEVFAGEVCLHGFANSLERAHDQTTDLDLWDLPHGG